MKTETWNSQQQSARERYQNDPTYRQVVNMMEHLLHTAQLTPSEIREASILASINYEMMTIRRYHIPMTEEMHNRLEEFDSIGRSYPAYGYTADQLKQYACDVLEKLSEEWSDAVQSDLENGVKFLSEIASKNLHRDYPEICKFGSTIEKLKDQL